LTYKRNFPIFSLKESNVSSKNLRPTWRSDLREL
jgi:hypothetical protein